MASKLFELLSTKSKSLILVAVIILAPAQASAGQAREVVVPHGLEVSIATAEELTSRLHHPGKVVPMLVTQDVKVGDLVVIARNTPVRGVVDYSKKCASFGRGGTLSLSIDSTRTVDGQIVKLRGSYIVLGTDRRGETTLSRLLARLLSLFNRGRDARINAGTAMKAYVEVERRVAMK